MLALGFGEWHPGYCLSLVIIYLPSSTKTLLVCHVLHLSLMKTCLSGCAPAVGHEG